MKREIHGKETLLEFHEGSLHMGDLGVFREEAGKRGMPDIHIPSRILKEYRFMKEPFPLPPIFPICFRGESRQKLITIFKMS